MQMMWIHRSVAQKLSSTVLPGRAAGSPSSCLFPLLGRTQILCSRELHAVFRQKRNWGFASICMKIAAKICYHLGLLANIKENMLWTEMSICGNEIMWLSVSCLAFVFCTNLVRLFTCSIPSFCVDSDSPSKSFLCMVSWSWIRFHRWWVGQKEQVKNIIKNCYILCTQKHCVT